MGVTSIEHSMCPVAMSAITVIAESGKYYQSEEKMYRKIRWQKFTSAVGGGSQ